MILIVGYDFTTYKEEFAERLMMDHGMSFLELESMYPFIDTPEKMMPVKRYTPLIFLWDAWKNPKFDQMQKLIKAKGFILVGELLHWPEQRGEDHGKQTEEDNL